MRSVLYPILSILVLSTFHSLAGDRDHPKELAVLERFIGVWDHVVTLKHPGGGRDSIQKTESKRSWSLGGSYLRIEEVNWERPEFDEFQMLLTFDVLKKIYSGVIIDGLMFKRSPHPGAGNPTPCHLMRKVRQET